MMRFIEPIVPGIQVHRHNRHVSIPNTVERRYSIDFQFLDGVAFVCREARLRLLGKVRLVSTSPSRCFQIR